ncbi:MAG: hypothetical protein DBP00_07290 [gamma proteobacterium symbiont of Ctena orbiculata]|nr:MAG: hypothetical protein DBP00_07290 [gamma proteobacterium symbiont of Ctena orbiculata]
MKYSDWQLNRLRDALSAFKAYQESSFDFHEDQVESLETSREVGFSWGDVREAIREETGVEIGVDRKTGSERLRQFVAGIKKNDGSYRFPRLSKKWLDAIADFVTSEDIFLLDEEELHEFDPTVQTPIRLLEYLNQNYDYENTFHIADLKGAYERKLVNDDVFVVTKLTFQGATDKGFMQVIEERRSYDASTASRYDNFTYDNKRKEQLSFTEHKGWAVSTPETGLLFFMKNAMDGKNYNYLSLASDLPTSGSKTIGTMALIHHDYSLWNVTTVNALNFDNVIDGLKWNPEQYVALFVRQ